MQYLDYLEMNKDEFVAQLEQLLSRFKVQPVGNGYIDCIVMRESMKPFINAVTDLGLLI